MKKVLIAIALTVSPLTQAATDLVDSQAWTKFGYAMWGVRSQEAQVNLAMIARDSKNATTLIGFTYTSEDCLYSDTTVQAGRVAKFNGQNVLLNYQCIGKGAKFIIPRTQAGEQFVIDTFTKSNEVTVEYEGTVRTYSAKNFAKSNAQLRAMLSDQINNSI